MPWCSQCLGRGIASGCQRASSEKGSKGEAFRSRCWRFGTKATAQVGETRPAFQMCISSVSRLSERPRSTSVGSKRPEHSLGHTRSCRTEGLKVFLRFSRCVRSARRSEVPLLTSGRPKLPCPLPPYAAATLILNLNGGREVQPARLS